MDKNIYVKEGRKYKPIGFYFQSNNEWLTEGVWLVLNKRYGKETIKGDYLKSLFGIDKMSDLKNISFAELGDIHKTADEILSRLSKINIDNSISGIVHTTLRLLKEIQQEEINKK